MSNESLCLLFLFFCWFCDVFGRYDIFPSCWNSCPAKTNVVFKTLYNVALQKCAFECYRRPTCHGAYYHSLTKECAIVNVTSGNSVSSTRIPHAFIQFNDIEEKFRISGLCRRCGTDDICEVNTRNNASDCDYYNKAVCPDNWIQRGDSCYKSVEAVSNQSIAEELCKQLHQGAHLAYIHTNEELQTLGNIELDSFKLWIGGQKDENGVWSWNDGTVVGEWGWQPDEPSNGEGISCMVIIMKRGNVGYRDRMCYVPDDDNLITGLCEINLEPDT